MQMARSSFNTPGLSPMPRPSRAFVRGASQILSPERHWKDTREMDHALAMKSLPDPARNPELYESVPAKRLLAWFVDLAVTLALTMIVIPLTAFTALFFLPFLWLVVSFLYRWVTLTTRSATWGMRFAAIEIRGPDGGPLDATQAGLHTLGYSISFAIFPLQLVSIVLMLLTDKKQGLSDHILGTAAMNRRARF